MDDENASAVEGPGLSEPRDGEASLATSSGEATVSEEVHYTETSSPAPLRAPKRKPKRTRAGSFGRAVKEPTLELRVLDEPGEEVENGLTAEDGVHTAEFVPERAGPDSEVTQISEGNEIPVSENVNPMSQEQYKTLEKDVINRVEFSKIEKKFLTQYLLYQDKNNHVQVDSSNPVVQAVTAVRTNLCRMLQRNDTFRGGQINECGSFHEDTKVGSPNEFDFIYKISFESYTALRADLSRTKALKSHLKSKAYYNLYRGEVTEETVNEDRKIKACLLHEDFREAVEKNLQQMFGIRDRSLLVKKAGPAVKFVLLVNENGREKQAKVDLTLAVEVNPTVLFEDRTQLRSYAVHLLMNQELECCFVPAHDYWKLSFNTTEKSIMTSTSALGYKGVCYRAIKILRDAVDVRDTLGDGILSSYPLKVAHMKKTISTFLTNTDKAKWTKEKVASNVIEMARGVSGDGERQLLTGVFLRNDNIMGESDRSYLEGRRIVNELKHIATHHKEHGIINTVTWAILIFCALWIDGFVIYAILDTDWKHFENDCVVNDTASPPFPLDFTFLLFFSGFVWLAALTSIVCAVCVHIFTKKWRRQLFLVLPNLRWVYVVIAMTSFFLFVCDMFLVADYIRNESCTHLGKKVNIDTFGSIIFVLATVPLIMFIVSFTMNLIYWTRHRGTYTCSIFDAVFFEFPQCRKHLEPSIPERNSSTANTLTIEQDLSYLDTYSSKPDCISYM